MDRRDFFKAAGAGGALAILPGSVSASEGVAAPADQRAPAPQGDREAWIAVLRRLADPVLTNLANGTLKLRMPVEQSAGAKRQTVTHLEALGRLIAGIAPWMELPADDTAEGRLRVQYADLARRAIGRAVDP